MKDSKKIATSALEDEGKIGSTRGSMSAGFGGGMGVEDWDTTVSEWSAGISMVSKGGEMLGSVGVGGRGVGIGVAGVEDDTP